MQKKLINYDQFSVRISNPKTRLTITQVTVYADGRFCMNSRLAGNFYKKPIEISFTPDGRYLAIKENESADSMLFPKSGAKKLKDVTDLLQSQKIQLPAQYDVFYNEKYEFWQGDLIESPMKQPSEKHQKAKKN